jgi:hypothetical protein
MRYIKTYIAEGAVTKHRFVSFGTTDNQIGMASASTDLLVGVSTEQDTADTAVCDVIHLGEAKLVLGGTVSAGDRVTSNASGAGVTATTGTVGAIALKDGVAGDVIPVIVQLNNIGA